MKLLRVIYNNRTQLKIHIHFFLKNSLLCLAQSGFHALLSHETALTRPVLVWTANMGKGLLNGISLLDLRKDFDLVDIDVLLKN